jgi:diketogulonate reductase-like aldo/keto reductase
MLCADAHPHTCMQVLIRWALERGCSVLPKSTNPGRIASNLSVSSWRIDAADIQTLSNMPYQVSLMAAAAWHAELLLWSTPQCTAVPATCR